MTMPPELVLHPQTVKQLERLIDRKPHAIVLQGQTGIGKYSVALRLASSVIGHAEPLKAIQQVLLINRGEDKHIVAEQIRAIEQFLSRRMAGGGQRVVLIDEAHTMTPEAQNALLKTLEEPPEGTMIILTAAVPSALLPTVRSRAVLADVRRPEPGLLKEFFLAGDYPETVVEQAMLMSGGLPGLMHALLSDESHPLKAAATLARQIVQANRFERLIIADKLSKQRAEATDVCDILQQMAHVKLITGTLSASWQRLLSESYTASEQLRRSAQPKLVLTNLMLNL